VTADLEPGDTVIVAVLGIIYATIRSAALFQYFTITQMAWASDVHSLEQKRFEDPNVDREIAKTDESKSRILLNCYIAAAIHRASVHRLPDIHLLKAVNAPAS
jgi:hypothetical protein